MYTEKLPYSHKKKQQIIKNLRAKGLRFVDIARILGVSRQRVHQLDKNYKSGDGKRFYKKKIICEICGTTRIIKKDTLSTLCYPCIQWRMTRRLRRSTKTVLRQYQKTKACEMCLHPFEEKGQHAFRQHNRCLKCTTRLAKAKNTGDKRIREYLKKYYQGEQNNMKWPLQTDIPYTY